MTNPRWTAGGRLEGYKPPQTTYTVDFTTTLCPRCFVEHVVDEDDPHSCDPQDVATATQWAYELIEANERNPAVLAMRRSFARRRRLKRILTLGRSK